MATSSNKPRAWRVVPFAILTILFLISICVNRHHVGSRLKGADVGKDLFALRSRESNTETSAQNWNYVAFSVTLNTFARDEDYDYLAALVARNWLIFGFRPIVIVAASDMDTINKAQQIWDIIMPKQAHIIHLLVRPEIAIPVAQMSRLYAAALLPQLPNESFLRITDADMMILDPKPFLPPPSGANISIYNGRCCLRGNKVVGRNVTCNQYPMHSAGMKVGLWRKLFSVEGQGTDAVTSHILELAGKLFSFREGAQPIRHGRHGWAMDQILLGCNVDDAVRDGYELELSPGPSRRLHNHGSISNQYTDIHLASFGLHRHGSWLNNLVNETILLDGYREEYISYTDTWAKHHNITLDTH